VLALQNAKVERVPDQVVIEPTLAGDANMDGQVSFADTLILGQNNGSNSADWAHADFNYSGTVDFNDTLIQTQNSNNNNGNTGCVTVYAAMPFVGHPNQ